MFSFTTRLVRSTSILAMLLGMSLSVGSVACVATTGADEADTTSAAAAAQEEAPSKANANASPSEPQEEADAGSKDPTLGDTVTGQTPPAKEPGQGGGGGDSIPVPPRAGHTSPSMQ